MGMKRDAKFALSAQEKQDAVMLLKILLAKAKQNPRLKPNINIKDLRNVWPSVRELWR